MILNNHLRRLEEKSAFLGAGAASGLATSAIFDSLGIRGFLQSSQLPTVQGYEERMKRFRKLMVLYGETIQKDIQAIRKVADNLESADKT